MNARTNKNIKSVTNNGFTGLEALEGRQMMSASHAHAPAKVIHHHHAASTVKAVVVAPTPAPTPVVSTALGVNQIAYNGGIELQIQGTTGNDQITVSQTGNTFTIKNGTWSDTVTGNFKELSIYGNGGNDSITLAASVTINADIHGGVGNDTIVDGNGNDSIYGGTMNNVITAGKGNDTIVTIGSEADTITGGAGYDSFWIDNSTSEKILNESAAEVAGNTVHKVGSFLSVQTATGAVAISKTLGMKAGVLTTLAEPTTTESDITYSTNFSSQPLFATTGPSVNDINQGYVGDCYFLSTLASVAKTDPNLIEQSVVSLGDGTFAVQFHQNGQSVFVRVDGELPTWSWGQIAYEGEGAQGSIWASIMEKAFAVYRDASSKTVASYSNIDSGWMDEVYADLGSNATDIWSATSGTQLLSLFGKALAQGKSATFAVNNAPANSGLVSSHAYTVISVQNDANGNPTITLRNPWGVGANGTGNGYITLSATVAYQAFWAGMTASV
jgi:hypothetical protein